MLPVPVLWPWEVWEVIPERLLMMMVVFGCYDFRIVMATWNKCIVDVLISHNVSIGARRPNCVPGCWPLLLLYFPRHVECAMFNNNNNRRLVTLVEHTSDHGKQTNSSTKERGSRVRKLLGAKAKSYRLKLSRLVSKAPTSAMFTQCLHNVYTKATWVLTHQVMSHCDSACMHEGQCPLHRPACVECESLPALRTVSHGVSHSLLREP